MTFISGELYITQKIKGIANGALSLVTTIAGNTPEFGEINSLHLTNITETFEENSDGSTSSISTSHIRVNGKSYEVKTSRFVRILLSSFPAVNVCKKGGRFHQVYRFPSGIDVL